MDRQDWEMSVEEFNDCGCAMNGDQWKIGTGLKFRKSGKWGQVLE